MKLSSFFADRASNFWSRKFVNLWNIILGAFDDDGDYGGDDADDNYDGDANCAYNQDYECWEN